MTERVNPPGPQPGPVAFVGVCVVGCVAAIRGLLTLRAATEPWWTGVLGLCIIAVGFALVIGGWLWIQREVTFGPDTIAVRRWLEVLLGRPGRVLPLNAGTRSAIVLENVRSLRLEHDGYQRIQLTLG